MSAASDVLENRIINYALRGIAPDAITGNYVALHTADPTDTGSNEVTTTAFPSYTRKDVTNNGAVTLSNAWTVPSNGTSKNTQQLIFPVYDGASPITVTHYSIWDAQTAGNMIVHAPLQISRQIVTGDVFVADVEKLTVTVL